MKNITRSILPLGAGLVSMTNIAHAYSTTATVDVSMSDVVYGFHYSHQSNASGTLIATTMLLNNDGNLPIGAAGSAAVDSEGLRAFAYAPYSVPQRTQYNVTSLATFQDYFTISGASSASFTLSLAVSGSLIESAESGPAGMESYDFESYIDDVTHFAQYPSASAYGSFALGESNTPSVMTLVAGDEYQFNMSFTANAETALDYVGSGPPTGFAESDYSDTGNVYLVSSTPGVAINSVSGYSYQPVPEPSTLAGLGLGVLPLLRKLRKKRNA